MKYFVPVDLVVRINQIGGRVPMCCDVLPVLVNFNVSTLKTIVLVQ